MKPRVAAPAGGDAGRQLTAGCGRRRFAPGIKGLAAGWSMVVLAGCGYHVAGSANLLPKNIQTIAVPAFQNATTQYKISDDLGAAITRELITRTRYRVVADPSEADAVLSGAVANYISYPTIYDPKTNRGTGVEVVVSIQVSLRDRRTGKVLFNRGNMDIHERYEISLDPKNYFDESEGAMLRVSRDVARDVVSSILANF